MTTIAIKDGIIAYDSRCRQGETIASDCENKRVDENGVSFFFAGNVCDQRHLIDMYFGKDVSADHNKMSINAYTVSNGVAWLIGVCKTDGFWMTRVRYPEAIGSGTDHALTAMDMGATAKEAVKWAKKRDSGTGGRIRTFKITEEK